MVLAGSNRSRTNPARRGHRHRNHGEPGLGRNRLESSGGLGLLHHQFRVLDWHQPRRGDAVRHFAPGQGRVAATRHPRRRGADPVLADDGDDYAHRPHRTALAYPLLGVSLRLCPRHLAQHQDAAGLGPQRHSDLPDLQHFVRNHRADTRLCGAARPHHRHRPPGLQRPGHGLGRQCPPMEAANCRRRTVVGLDSARVRFGAQYRVLGLRHGGLGQVVALHRVRSLLRGGRGALRRVGGGLCADSAALVLRLAGLHPPRTH